jgi:hypothetical protein
MNTNENGKCGVTSHTQMLLVYNSQHVSAQIGHHQVVLEEYTNVDGILKNYNTSIEFLLVKIGSEPTHTIDTMHGNKRLLTRS